MKRFLLAALAVVAACWVTPAAAVPPTVLLSDVAGATSASNYVTPASGGTCGVGDVAIAVITIGSSFTINSFADSASNSWTAGTSGNASTQRVRAFASVLTNAITTSTTFTVGMSSSGQPYVLVHCFSTPTGLGPEGIGTANIGSTTSGPLTTATLSSPPYTVFFYGFTSAGGGTFTQSWGTASGTALNANFGLRSFYKETTSASTETFSATHGSANNIVGYWAFTEPAAAAQKGRRLLLGVGR